MTVLGPGAGEGPSESFPPCVRAALATRGWAWAAATLDVCACVRASVRVCARVCDSVRECPRQTLAPAQRRALCQPRLCREHAPRAWRGAGAWG